MPWKLGGNFENVRLMCQTTWQECTAAVAYYMWFEIVSDVVDFLRKEGMIWTLAIAIISAILFCVNSFRKGTHADSNVRADQQMLYKVRHKIQDLELKINVLTYKMQYGTWPLPHQIYSLNPKKLRKIKMSLSNPVDRNSWIKHVLLSPTQSDIHDPSLTKLTGFFGTKHNLVAPHHIQRGKSPTVCSSIETSKSTSDQSVNACCLRNMNAEDSDLSKSGDFTLQRQNNIQLLPLVNKYNRGFSGKLSVQSSLGSTKFNLCQDFTNTVHRCRSFLKGSEDNDKRLLKHSSERKVSSLKDAQPASLTAEKREILDAARKTARRKDTNETKCATEDVGQVQSRQSNTDASSNSAAVMNKPMNQSARSVRASRETLYQVRRRLQSLYNVLRTYENTNRSSERWKAAGQVGDIGAFASIVPKTEKIGENKVEANHDSSSRKAPSRVKCSIVNSCEYFELDCTGESSSSSLAGCLSNASSKTYQYSSDVALRSIRSKEYDQHNVRRSACKSDLIALASSCNQLPPFHSATSHVSEYRKYQRERNGCVEDISDHSCGLESSSQTDENATRTSVSFNLREEESPAEKTGCILSPGNISVENYNAPLVKEAAIEEINDAFDGEHYQGNTMIISRSSSQSKTCTRSDPRRKSTALLLQEALLFKRALLTRVESEKRCLMHSTEGNNVAGESPTSYEIESSNNFPTIVVNIETEGPVIDSVHGQLDRHYVRLEMKQRSDLIHRDLRDVTVLAPCQSKGDADNEEVAREIPSEYFSLCDLAVPGNEEIDMPLSLKPPIYEKVISIMIPVDVKGEDAESSRRDSGDANVNADLDEKRLPVMRGLEDLILERVKNIRDYIDIFLHSQDTAISKARRALQAPDEESVSSRYSDNAGHVILHGQLAILSKCNSIDRPAAASLKHHKLGNSEEGILKSQRRIFKNADANAIMPGRSDTECPESEILVDLNFIPPGQPDCDYSTEMETKETNNVICEPGECPLSFLLNAKEEMLNDGSLSDIRRDDPQVSENVVTPRMRHSTRRLRRTNSGVKARGDVSLITGATKNSNVSLRQKRSHSSFTYRDTLERIRRALHQSEVKLRDDIARCEGESPPVTPSKSLLLPQRISTKSCIPILRNRLEAIRMRHQSNARSPTRGPLTMLWRENACMSRTAGERATRRKHGISRDKGSRAEQKTALLNLSKAHTRRNREKIVEEPGEANARHGDSDTTITNNSDVLSDDQNTESLKINKEYTDKRHFTCDGRSDEMVMNCVTNTTPKTLTIVSIITSEDSQRNCPTDSLVLNTRNVRPVTDLSRYKAELRSVVKKEQEVTVKPSIADTCTSMSDILGANRGV